MTSFSITVSYKRSGRDGAFINDKLKRGWHLIDVWLDIYNRVQQISFINNTAIVPIRNVTWERVALGATRAPWPATIPLQSADWEPQVVGKQRLITRRYSAQRLYSLHLCVRCQKLLESTSKFMSLRVRSCTDLNFKRFKTITQRAWQMNTKYN